MEKPESLLNAAKRLAELSGYEWSHVQKYYKALQGTPNKEDGWLPRSLGRNIWYAHPNFITRLIVALAVADTPTKALDVAKWANSLSPNGLELTSIKRPSAGVHSQFEVQMEIFLRNPKEAKKLTAIEFNRDIGTVIFRTFEQHDLVFAEQPGSEYENDDIKLIQHRGVVNGELIVKLAESIHWHTMDQPPLRKTQQGEVGDDE